eukprot:8394806-Pyramimonas_sp.AAC.1
MAMEGNLVCERPAATARDYAGGKRAYVVAHANLEVAVSEFASPLCGFTSPVRGFASPVLGCGRPVLPAAQHGALCPVDHPCR